MKRIIQGTVALAAFALSLSVATDASAGKKRKAASEANKNAATAFCNQYEESHPGAECKVDKRTCPKGYVAERKWKGKGTNYSACVRGKKKERRQKRKAEKAAISAENKAAAEAYCDTLNNCKVVKGSIKGCGKGWTKSETFRGKGPDYLACVHSKRRKGTIKNKADADARCVAERADGFSCLVKRASVLGCGGKKWKRVAKFKGKGKNYIVCTRPPVFEVKMTVYVTRPQTHARNADDVKFIEDSIAHAESLYSRSPALVIDHRIEYITHRGGKDLNNLDFKNKKKFHKWMDKHFDHVATSKTSGHMVALAVAPKVGSTGNNYSHIRKGEEKTGIAPFPKSVKWLGRKHGPLIQLHHSPSHFSHELGHLFGLKHSFGRYGNSRCNKGYGKGEKGEGSTLRADGSINVMDYSRGSRVTYLNDCQQDRAARTRRRWMTKSGKVNYKDIRGRR